MGLVPLQAALEGADGVLVAPGSKQGPPMGRVPPIAVPRCDGPLRGRDRLRRGVQLGGHLGLAGQRPGEVGPELQGLPEGLAALEDVLLAP
jgi:hypothetical protein